MDLGILAHPTSLLLLVDNAPGRSTPLNEPPNIPSQGVIERLEEVISTVRELLPEYEYFRLQVTSILATNGDLPAEDADLIELEQLEALLAADMRILDEGVRWLRGLIGLPQRPLASSSAVVDSEEVENLRAGDEGKLIDRKALKARLALITARHAELRASTQAVGELLSEVRLSPTSSMLGRTLRFN
jgi:hypothetical protein